MQGITHFAVIISLFGKKREGLGVKPTGERGLFVGRKVSLEIGWHEGDEGGFLAACGAQVDDNPAVGLYHGVNKVVPLLAILGQLLDPHPLHVISIARQHS